jgi:hypothetical protein
MYVGHIGTVIYFRNIRIVIYSADHGPAHGHVIAPGAEAKIEIETLRIVWSVGFRTACLALAIEQVRIHQKLLLGIWNEIHEG